MPKIIMLTPIVGTNFSASLGDLVEFSQDDADRLVASGQAEYPSKDTKPKPSPLIENATLDVPPIEEKTVSKKGKSKGDVNYR